MRRTVRRRLDMKRHKLISQIIMYTFLIIIVAFSVFPLIYTLLASFKTNTEIMVNPEKILPESFQLNNFREVWLSKSFNVGRLFLNSVIYTVSLVVINLVSSVVLGYVFATGRFKFKKLIFICFTGLMFIRSGGIGIYATFQILDFLHIPQNLYTLIGMALFGVPIVNIFLVRSYIDSIPYGIAEAAKIDGCGYSGILYRVYLPMLKPIMATIVILSFQAFWNDYLNPTFYTLTRPEQRTLMVGLMSFQNTEAATSWNLMLAGAAIAVIPVLLIYALCSKYFVQGITAGAVKG